VAKTVKLLIKEKYMSFKVAGVSKFKDGYKVRFANDLARVKVLNKSGHSEIDLIELPSEMEKPEVVKYLMTTSLMENANYRATIEEADAKYNGEQTVKVKAAKVKTAKVEQSETVTETV
jgi:hypothetical protein